MIHNSIPFPILYGLPRWLSGKRSHLPMQETLLESLDLEDPLEQKWQLTPVFLPGTSHGQRSLAGYSPWGHKESDLATNKMISLGKTKSCIPAGAL